jgi:tubulin polyglutamylase TTLL9
VRFKTPWKNTILDVMRRRPGWEDVTATASADGGGDPDDWDFYWADKPWVRDVLPRQPLREHQRLNHFPNFYELTRKDNLAKNLKRMKRQLEREGSHQDAAAHFDFFPASYLLPAEYPVFVEAFKKQAAAHPGTLWIMKPVGRSQGKGIFLFSKVAQIADWKVAGQGQESYVVQRYLADPYLVGGKKFDMRIYCLCVAYQPLTVYLYRAGFARFTFTRYSTRPEDMGDTFVHLTNVAVQKHSEGYDPECGCKWALRELRMHMLRRNGRAAVDAAWFEVQRAILNSLLSVQRIMVSDRRCFELYGYDVLFDASLKPFILEVNASPSMTAENPRDYHLKSTVLNDTLDLVDIDGKRAEPDQLFESYGGFDLVFSEREGWSKPYCTLGFCCPGVDGPKQPPKPFGATASGDDGVAAATGDECPDEE